MCQSATRKPHRHCEHEASRGKRQAQQQLSQAHTVCFYERLCCATTTHHVCLKANLMRVFTITDGNISINITASTAAAAGLDNKALSFLARWSTDYKYCEAKYGSILRGKAPSMMDSDHWMEADGAPFFEWGAVVSASAIIWCGCHMLLFWRHDSTMLHLIASLFIVNGLSAAVAHGTNIYSWHRIDGMSMALTAWLATGFLFEEIAENFYATRKHMGQRAMLRMISWFLFLLVFWWFSETNAAIGNFELGDHIDFAITMVPLVMVTLMSLIVIRQGWAVSTYVDSRVLRKTNVLFIRGLCIASFGIVSWVGTELLCDSVKLVRWFPGHFIWHLTVSYGFTLMMLLGGVLRADNFKKKPRIWRPSRHGGQKGWCNHGAYNVFTSFYFDILPEFAHVDPALDATSGFESVALSAVHSVGKTKCTERARTVNLMERSTTQKFRISQFPTEIATKLRDRLQKRRAKSSETKLAGTVVALGMRSKFKDKLRRGSARVAPPKRAISAGGGSRQISSPGAQVQVTDTVAGTGSAEVEGISRFDAVLPTPGDRVHACATACNVDDIADVEHALLDEDISSLHSESAQPVPRHIDQADR